MKNNLSFAKGSISALRNEKECEEVCEKERKREIERKKKKRMKNQNQNNFGAHWISLLFITKSVMCISKLCTNSIGNIII